MSVGWSANDSPMAHALTPYPAVPGQAFVNKLKGLGIVYAYPILHHSSTVSFHLAEQ
jgi:hypothetical protein